MKRLNLIVLSAACALVACSSGPDGFKLEISAQRLQAKLSEQFPKEECRAVLVCLSAHSPQLVLVDGSPRIGLKVALAARSPLIAGATAQAGTATASAKLRYVRTEAALYLDDVKVDEIKLNGVPDAVGNALRELSPAVIGKNMSAKPIYQIPADKLTEKLQALVLRDVQIQGGKIVALVGLPG